MYCGSEVSNSCDCLYWNNNTSGVINDTMRKEKIVLRERKKTLEYEKESKDMRREEALTMRARFPNKIPVLVQKYWKDNQLPQLDKSKYLVPKDITMSQFQTIIRNRMRMGPNQALYLLVNERSMLSLSLTLGEVYSEHAEPNGFLYITYASQEAFGTEIRCNSTEKSGNNQGVLSDTSLVDRPDP